MTSDRHPLDELHDVVAGQAGDEARRGIEQHLDVCPQCRAERDRLAFTRDLLRRFAGQKDVPLDLESRIARALDREVPAVRVRRRRFVLAGLAAAVVAVLVVTLLRPRGDLPSAAAADYVAVATGELPLEMRTTDPSRLEAWLDERLEFRTRVFDFGMMRYQLIGGRIDSLSGRRTALFAYRGERGDVIVCEMYEGRTAELPRGAQRRMHDGIEFHVYQRDGTTAVFWQEGAVVCVLTGAGAPENVISLAFAKAMKV